MDQVQRKRKRGRKPRSNVSSKALKLNLGTAPIDEENLATLPTRSAQSAPTGSAQSDPTGSGGMTNKRGNGGVWER